jgi:hypothetical protein
LAVSDGEVEKVGYKCPPKSGRIRKGERRNPNGRRGKKKVPAKVETEAEILVRLDSELVEFQGGMITRKEASLRVLYSLAMKGNSRAITALERLRATAKAGSEEQRGGVLVVPGTVPLEQWSLAAIKQQAQYRESVPYDEVVVEASASKAASADSDEAE